MIDVLEKSEGIGGGEARNLPLPSSMSAVISDWSGSPKK